MTYCVWKNCWEVHYSECKISIWRQSGINLEKHKRAKIYKNNKIKFY